MDNSVNWSPRSNPLTRDIWVKRVPYNRLTAIRVLQGILSSARNPRVAIKQDKRSRLICRKVLQTLNRVQAHAARGV